MRSNFCHIILQGSFKEAALLPKLHTEEHQCFFCIWVITVKKCFLLLSRLLIRTWRQCVPENIQQGVIFNFTGKNPETLCVIKKGSNDLSVQLYKLI